MGGGGRSPSFWLSCLENISKGINHIYQNIYTHLHTEPTCLFFSCLDIVSYGLKSQQRTVLAAIYDFVILVKQNRDLGEFMQ